MRGIRPPDSHALRRCAPRALLVLIVITLLAGCTTGTHWRMDRAQPPRPSSFSSESPVLPAKPWWEDYRPLIPQEQDTCALLQKSAQVKEDLRLASGRDLHPQQALALWSWLAKTPLPLRTFAPRTALAWLLRHTLARGQQVPASELRPLCERFLAIVVMRPDGYLASASTGEPLQRMGQVVLREGTLAVGGFLVGRLYLSHGGVFYPLDDELYLSSHIPLGELRLEKDLLNSALDGAQDAMEETARALATSVQDLDGTLEGLLQLPTTVATLIASSPEYFARYGDRPLREQVREAARLSTHLLMLTGGAVKIGASVAGPGARLPVLRLGAQGTLAVEVIAVPAGAMTATLARGAGALVVLSAPPSLDPKAARAQYEKGMQEARRSFPHLFGGPKQKHHVHPRYLGGPEDGPTVDLDPAYHQLITNEFRRLASYGRRTPLGFDAVWKLMKQVYTKYPLPGVHF
jgi:hypothetical protein